MMPNVATVAVFFPLHYCIYTHRFKLNFPLIYSSAFIWQTAFNPTTTSTTIFTLMGFM